MLSQKVVKTQPVHISYGSNTGRIINEWAKNGLLIKLED